MKRNIVTRKTLKGPGLSIALVGADGSGKSTLSKDISEWLSWKIDTNGFYLGAGDGVKAPYVKLARWAHKKYSGLKGSTAKKSEADESSKEFAQNKPKENVKKKKSFIKSTIKSGFDAFNMLYLLSISRRAYKILNKSRSYTDKGCIAIYDRFPQTQFPGLNDGPKIRHKYGKKSGFGPYGALMKREESYIARAAEEGPDLVLKLLVPPEVSIQRKPSHNYETVAKKAKLIKDIEFKNSAVFEIDANQEYEKELREVKNIIWREIEKRSY